MLSGFRVLASCVAVVTQILAVKFVLPDLGFPLATLAMIVVRCLLLAGAGWHVRRWHIRGQNPALYEEY